MSSSDLPDLKLQARAKRFNLVFPDDKNLARANRFGLEVSNISTPSLPKVTSPKKLKQRSQKFLPAAATISKEEDEKRRLRQDRFGSGVLKPEIRSKLASRAERFAV